MIALKHHPDIAIAITRCAYAAACFVQLDLRVPYSLVWSIRGVYALQLLCVCQH